MRAIDATLAPNGTLVLRAHGWVDADPTPETDYEVVDVEQAAAWCRENDSAGYVFRVDSDDQSTLIARIQRGGDWRYV